MENQEITTLELEQENNIKENENNSCNNNKSKKSLKWLWISLSIIALIAIIVWCAVSAVKINGTKILDKNGNGVVFNGLYGSDSSNIYAKPIKNGESSYQLSPEEKYAIEIAEQNKNFQARHQNNQLYKED